MAPSSQLSEIHTAWCCWAIVNKLKAPANWRIVNTDPVTLVSEAVGLSWNLPVNCWAYISIQWQYREEPACLLKLKDVSKLAIWARPREGTALTGVPVDSKIRVYCGMGIWNHGRFYYFSEVGYLRQITLAHSQLRQRRSITSGVTNGRSTTATIKLIADLVGNTILFTGKLILANIAWWRF